MFTGRNIVVSKSRGGQDGRLVFYRPKEEKKVVFGPKNNRSPYVRYSTKERLRHHLLRRFGKEGGVFDYALKYDKLLWRHKARFYREIYEKLKYQFLCKQRRLPKQREEIVLPSNRYTVLPMEYMPEESEEEIFTFGDFFLGEVDELAEEAQEVKRPKRARQIDEFDIGCVPCYQAQEEEWEIVRNPTLLNRLRLIIQRFVEVRIGMCKHTNIFEHVPISTERYDYIGDYTNIVEPQMGERHEVVNTLMPTAPLNTTQSGIRMFGESFNNLKDVCRRYQLYWEGVIRRRKLVDNQRNVAVLCVPVIPSGLDLDYANPTTGIWNLQRDGAIPIISSGYRFYRGSIRMRFVFPVVSANVWIQHRPDLPIDFYKVLVGNEIDLNESFRNHNYGFYIQSLAVNNIVEVEIPFYQPGIYGFLNKGKYFTDTYKNNKLEIKEYVGLGCVLIGFENGALVDADLDVSVYYSIGDDMSYHVFKGFPPMVYCDKTVSRVSPQMEDAHGQSESSVKASNVVLGQTENESVDVSAIPAPVLWTNYSSTEQNPQYKNLTDRFFYWDNVTWSTEGKPTDSLLFYKNLPIDILNSVSSPCTVPMLVPFTIHKYWRGDIEVKVQVNSNKFQVGQLQCSWLYMASQDESSYSNIWSNSQRPHCLISAGASNEASLYIPYKHCKPYLMTKGKTGSDRFNPLDLGMFQIRVVSPLTIAPLSKGPKSCNLSIFVRFVNSEFTGMRDASIVDPQMMSAVGMMSAVSLVDKLIGDKNCDNPPMISPPRMLVPTASHSWCIGNNISEPIHSLRLVNTRTGVGRDSEVGVNEMDNSVPCSIFGMLKHITWTSVDSSKNIVGYKLAAWDVHPQCDRDILHIHDDTGTLNTYVIPPVGVVSSLYHFWRGSLEFRFDIIASQFHTGRLLIAYIPGVSGDAEVSLEQARNSAHVVFSLQESQSFTFVVPYIADKPWWPRKYGGPQRKTDFVAPSRIYIFVLNSLIPMEAVSPSVTIVPYVRASGDFELAVPVQPSIGLSAITTHIVPDAKETHIKTGYESWYAGNWRYWSNNTKYILRYGEGTDHVTQFVPGSVKLQKGEVILWKPVGTTTKIAYKNNGVHTTADIEYIVLIPDESYVYGAPFPAVFRKNAIKLARAIAEGKGLAAADLAVTWLENGTAAPAGSTKFTPEIISENTIAATEDRYVLVEPEMMGSAISSLLGGVIGSTVSKAVNVKLSDIKEGVRSQLKTEVKNAVKPEVDRLVDSIKSVHNDVNIDIQQWFKEMGMTTVIGNVIHVLANPTPMTLAISLANVLGTLIQGSFSIIQTLILHIKTFLVKNWNSFNGIQTVEVQSDNGSEDFCKPLLSILFTGVCAMIGVTQSVKAPNSYFNLMRDVNVTAMLSNNIFTFLKNCTGAIGYYIQYALSYGDERKVLEAMLSNSMPDVKAWFNECNYLLDPRLENRLVYERQLIARVFDACVFGSILVSAGIDKHLPGGKIVWDTYKELVKLRNKLIERGAHADVRFECFPLWISGPPGIGKSYLTPNLCRQMLESINYRGEGTMVYYLEPGKKYWNGIQNHPVLVRDDAFQTEGTLLEEEVSSYFSICSSCILNPPLAAVEDKEKRINPLIYLLHSNFSFPTVGCCKCPEALYRRRKLLIEADLTEVIREKYPTFLDSSQLTSEEVKDFGHLRFRIANDPKNKHTAYGEWMSYSDICKIICDKFKLFYEKEQMNFRDRMRDMYRLDANFQDTYVFTEIPTLSNTLSLKEQVAQFKQAINDRLVDLDHNQVPETYLQWFRNHLSRLRDYITPQGPDDNADLFTEQVKNFFASRPLEVRNLELKNPSRNIEEIVREEVVMDNFYEVRNMTMMEHLVEIGQEIGLAEETMAYIFNGVNDLKVSDFSWLWLNAFSMPEDFLYEDNIQSFPLSRIDICDKELWFGGYDVIMMFKSMGWIEETAMPRPYANAPPGKEQALAYLAMYMEVMSQVQVHRVIEKDPLDINEQVIEYPEGYRGRVYAALFGVAEMKNEAYCKHSRLWTRALRDLSKVEYCRRTNKFYLDSVFGMRECIDACMCENSLFKYPMLYNTLVKLYNDFNQEAINLGNKESFVQVNNIVGFQNNFILSLENLRCWWQHSVSPFINKCIEFIIWVLPTIITVCIDVLIMYGIAVGIEYVAGWFFGGTPPPRCDSQGAPNYFHFNDAKSAKPGAVPAAKSFFQASPQQRQQMCAKIENNMVILHATWVENDVRMERSCRCLMIKGRLMLVLKHYIEEFQYLMNECTSKVTFTLLFNVSGKGSSAVIAWEDIVSNVKYASIAGGVNKSNYGILQLPKQFVLFKNILPLIATMKQHENVSSVVDMYCLSDRASFDLPIKQEKRYIINSTKASQEVELDIVYSYMRQSKGLCGSVLVSNNLGSGNGAIVGIHVGGSGVTGIGIAEPLYREMFECALDEFRMDPDVMPMTLEPLENANVELDSNVMLYGCVPAQFAHKESGKTKYLPSPIHGVVYPVITEPNPLRPGDRRQPPGSHPLRDGCNKLGSECIVPFASNVLAEAVQNEKDEMWQTMQPVRSIVAPLSLEQAVCGDTEVPYFESLEWSSSEGFPLSSQRPKGAHNKKWLFELTQGTFGYKLNGIHDKLKEQMRMRDLCFKKYVKPVTVYIDCLKDYRLTPKKCAIPGKTRIFSIAPIQCSLDIRMHMNDWCASVKNTRIKNGIAIGINPDSIEWTQLVNFLFEVGNKIITIDYSNFGPTLMSQVVNGAIECVVDWHKRQNVSEEHLNRVQWLLDCDILNPVHLCDNVVFQTLNGISSGSPLTGEMNSVPNKLYIKCAWVEIMSIQCPQYASLYYFNQFVRLVVYGDDLIMSVHDCVIDYFNALTLKDCLWKHGITITGAHKDEELKAFESIYEASFLKRGFVEHPKRNGIWLAPLEKQSIEECVNWIKDCGDDLGALQECVRSSCDMAYSRGEEYYMAHRERMIEVLLRLGVKLNIITWSDKDREIFDVCDEKLNESVCKIKMPWVYDLYKKL